MKNFLILMLVLSGCSTDEFTIGAAALLGHNNQSDCSVAAPNAIEYYQKHPVRGIDINYTRGNEPFAQSCKQVIMLADKNIPVTLSQHSGQNRTWFSFPTDASR